MPAMVLLPVKAAAETELPAGCGPAALPPVTVVTTLPLTQAALTPIPLTPTAGIAKFVTEPGAAVAVKRPSSSATGPVVQPCELL
ncbi:hypothetical protein GCM10027579_24220 [Calidifontibacter terrae]